MKITKNHNQIVSSRIVTAYNFTVENAKGEEMEIELVETVSDSDRDYFEKDYTLFNDKEVELTTEELETFFGEEYEDLIDNLMDNR